MAPDKKNPTVAASSRKPTGKKGGVSVAQVAELNVKNPIPFEYGGTAFDYLGGQRYIPFVGRDDKFGKTLLEARLLSATHSACVETKRDFCAGQGMVDKNGKEFSKEFAAYLKRCNAKNQSSNKINLKAFGSLFTFGNTPIEIVRLTVGKKKLVYVYVHNFLEWRLSWPDKNGIVRSAIHSKLFLRTGMLTAEQIKDARTVPLFDSSMPNAKKNWFVDENGAERTLIWLKNDMDGYEEYGMPQAVPSLIYQILEYKGARFNMDNFDNNMVMGGLIALKSGMSQTEANKIGKAIVDTHTGDGKRGRWAVIANEAGIDGSEMKEFNSQKEGSYEQLDNKCMEKIIMSNRWHAVLAGLDNAKALGRGANYILELYKRYKKTVIDPMQKYLIEDFWQPLQQIITDWTGIDAADYELDIQDIDPVSYLADVDPTPVVTVDEARAAIGLPPDPDETSGKQYLGDRFKLTVKNKPGDANA